MVVRVPEELIGELATIAARLVTETGLDYSQGAIVRGLLSLAPAFLGTRVKPGRKRGSQRSNRDLGAEEEAGGRTSRRLSNRKAVPS